MEITIRAYRETDSIPAITELLHRAYAPLLARGMQFTAGWQTDEMTLARIQTGTCLLAFQGDSLLGTVTVRRDPMSEAAYYRRPGVAYFGKFAVAPEAQGNGIGRMLFEAAKAEARRMGATELACDTAKPAADLTAMYQSWGMRIVGEADFAITNYESWIFGINL